MDKKICDYCGSEMRNGDIVFDGLDYCCDRCVAGHCIDCGDLLTPKSYKEFSGRCWSCNKEFKNRG